MSHSGALPPDWYRTSYASDFDSLYFEVGGEEKAALALRMLGAEGTERILDLACATGRRTLELSRRGHEAIGVDIRQALLEVAGCEAEMKDLWPYFVEEDTRYLDFEREFDLVLSLGGGAFEHFDYDEEALSAFAAAARALRPGGRLLMQTPNLLFVRAHLPERARIRAGKVEQIVCQHWNEPIGRIDGEVRSFLDEDPEREPETIQFQRRVYSISELFEIFASQGMRLTRVFDEHGHPCSPTDRQLELYVEARKPS